MAGALVAIVTARAVPPVFLVLNVLVMDNVSEKS
jgi:hypothetical protein